jgi:hypothetical protein
VGFDSLLQRDGPDAVRGRAVARFETRFQVAWVFGALVGIIPFGEGVGLLVLGLLLFFAGSSYLAALRSARTRPPRTTLRPEAVDRAFDKARDGLVEKYRQSKSGRRRAAERRARQAGPSSSGGTRGGVDVPSKPPKPPKSSKPTPPAPEGSRPPPPPRRGRRHPSA